MLHLSAARAASVVAVAGAALLAVQVPSAQAQEFNVTNLVSNGAVPAANIDPNLVNPWGVSYAPTGPFWVSDNGTGLTTLYTGSGAAAGLPPVTVPPSSSSPTGQVFNGSSTEFLVSNAGKTGASAFLFDTEDGVISGWAPSVSLGSAFVAVDNSDGGMGAVYKGLAIGSTGGSDFIYASNFRAGDVEMYNSSFSLVKTFTDPGVAAGYAPFNVQNLNGTLYVTFALQDAAKHDDVAGAGNGYVDAFSLDGTFERRLVSVGGQVNSPWGLDIAPASFGSLAGDLLVGNFGDGTISAFDPSTGVFEGQLLGPGGVPIVEGDLWALINGNDAAAGSSQDVYFTAGVQDESQGLFGAISAAPEPDAWALMLVGFGVMGASLRSHRRRQVRSAPA